MSFKFALAVAASAGLLALSAAQPGLAAKAPRESIAEARAKGQCFWAHRITSFASNDDRIINLRVGARDVYQLEMMGRCPDVEWANGIAIKSHGSNWICDGLDAEVIAPSEIGPQRCVVSKVRKLTVEETKALHKHARP